MSEKKTVTVTFEGEIPEHEGKKYPSVTLRKMKAKDLVAADLVGGEIRKAFAIFGSMAGVPIQVIEDLDMDDFEKLSEEGAPLMGKSAVKALAKLELENNPVLQ